LIFLLTFSFEFSERYGCAIHFAIMALWKHGFRGKTLVFAVTAAACQAFLLLGFDQGACHTL
jgi:hypothetical protein